MQLPLSAAVIRSAREPRNKARTAVRSAAALCTGVADNRRTRALRVISASRA
jgi:hypothetical protein